VSLIRSPDSFFDFYGGYFILIKLGYVILVEVELTFTATSMLTC